MTKDTGGTAFPLPSHTRKWDDAKKEYQQDEGMTLRDYFAAKALAAMIGKDNKDGANCGASGVGNLTAFAYEYADAMLEARK
jgi:hypothetical protein